MSLNLQFHEPELAVPWACPNNGLVSEKKYIVIELWTAEQAGVEVLRCCQAHSAEAEQTSFN